MKQSINTAVAHYAQEQLGMESYLFVANDVLGGLILKPIKTFGQYFEFFRMEQWITVSGQEQAAFEKTGQLPPKIAATIRRFVDSLKTDITTQSLAELG